MVRGITNFKKRFQGYEEQYVIIGGTACDLIMENEELPFRATKDIDLVLIVEALTAEFGETFWEFIKEAEYDHCNKSTGEAQLKDDRWNLCVECGMSEWTAEILKSIKTMFFDWHNYLIRKVNIWMMKCGGIWSSSFLRWRMK